MRKFRSPMTANLFSVKVFEGALIRMVESDDQRHDLAHAQATRTTAMPTRSRQQMLLPSGRKGLIKVIEIAIQGYNIHGRAPEQEWFRQP
jgi:hypothetical protein